MTPSNFEYINKLQDRLSVTIFFGRAYTSYTKEQLGFQPWEAQLEFRDDGTKVEVRGRGATPDEAMLNAYDKLHHVVANGIGAGALMPALETTTPKPKAIELAKFDDADEIPF